jgi:phosphoribosylanthranilate isomerase
VSVRVKICGVTTVEDARVCADAGADAIGLNFWPGSKRCVTVERAVEIARALPAGISKIGVFVDSLREDIERTAEAVGLDAVQLHGDEPPEACAALALPVIKAIRVSEALGSIDELVARYDVAWVLLDSAVGGSGVAFDWRRAIAVAPGRLYLAGGLRTDNVAQAVRCVRPYAVDTASGVEASPGRKDPRRVREFIENAKHA